MTIALSASDQDVWKDMITTVTALSSGKQGKQFALSVWCPSFDLFFLASSIVVANTSIFTHPTTRPQDLTHKGIKLGGYFLFS